MLNMWILLYANNNVWINYLNYKFDNTTIILVSFGFEHAVKNVHNLRLTHVRITQFRLLEKHELKPFLRTLR